LKTNK